MNTFHSRARTRNWTTDEKHLLVNIIQNHLDEIEVKKNDHATIHEKNKAWSVILQEFNYNQGGAGREMSAVRDQWKRMKRAAKVEWLDYKASIAENGGVRPGFKLSSMTATIRNMIPLEFMQIRPSRNQFDEDTAAVIKQNGGVSTLEYLEQESSQPAVTVTEINIKDEVEEVEEDDQVENNDDQSYIRTGPLTSTPQPSNNNQSNPTPWSKSKRPCPETPSSPLSMEDTLREHAELQHNLKIQHLEKEHAKRMEILELERRFHEKRLELLNVVNL